MKNTSIENIELEKIGKELKRYENQWIAISSDSKIVSNGRTYEEAVQNARGAEGIVLFKVPPLDVSFAPLTL